ncbi:thioredoxin family protein [Bacillus sp. B-jedd]|uniref:thioredoxin family protein n=1 Tax=Bacillus sp. B-jedd TaxID=1476857 RepID=UPI00051558CC|nr:thioredoxin family protein [Bacillus sp. B-jedd]CEG28450.1 Thioredoxin domain-containing protein [Bacillus sp. B-jedd]
MKEWTSEELYTFISNRQTGLAYFYTPLCGTCQVAGRMLEVIEELLPEMAIGKINLNYAPEFAEIFGVESVPCMVFIKEGQIGESIYAFRSVPYLLDKIKIFYS